MDLTTDVEKLKWKDDLDLFKLFITKEVHIFNNFDSVVLKAPTVNDLVTNNKISFIVSFLRKSFLELEPLFKLWKPKNNFDVFMILLNEAGKYSEYISYKNAVLDGFQQLFQDSITLKNNVLYIGDVLLTEALYNYIVYIVRKVSGETIEPPRVFKSKEEEEYFNMLQKNEDRIRKIKQSNVKKDDESMLKTFVTIQYGFPFYSFDFLTQQTLYQITWLREHASKAINYSIEEKALAAGNMKKKLKFFLEK